MKKSLARKIAKTGILAAGFLLIAGGTAQASDLVTAGNYGAGNGNQAVAAVQLPISVCGNAAGAGVANAGCSGDVQSDITADGLNNLYSTANYGLLNGNQVAATAQAPITVCGNAISVVGVTNAGCSGTSRANLGKRTVTTESAHVAEARHYDLVTSDNFGAGNGNQVAAIVQAPIAVCGNAVGAGVANAGCDGTVKSVAKPSLTPDMVTTGNYGLLNGNQVGAGVQAPITVCGNAVSVIGITNAGCRGNATAQAGSSHGEYSDYHHGTMMKPTAAAHRATGSPLGSLTGLLG